MEKDRRTILILGSTIAKLIWIDQARRLTEKGFRTFFFVLKRTPFEPEDKNIITVPIPRYILRHICEFIAVLRTHRPHHIEAFHDLFKWQLLLMYAFYVFIARLYRIPIVSVCMGGEILYWKRHSILKKWSIKVLLRSSCSVIVKEPYHKRYIDTYKIFNTRKIPVHELPNAVNIANDVQYDRDEDIILFLNSFKSWRHPEVLVKAFKLTSQKIPSARLIMAGYRTQEELEPIKKEIDNKIKDRISLIPYRLDNRALFAKAKIFVLPAEYIYLNNALLEAMERGVPPIISDVDIHGKKVIENGINGFIAKISAESLAEKIALLLKDEEMRQRMGKAARETVEIRFNNELRIDKLLSIYRSLH